MDTLTSIEMASKKEKEKPAVVCWAVLTFGEAISHP